MGIDRLMSILLILINEKNVTGRMLSEHFEVSLRTIYRDIEKLCEAGVPVAASGGVGGGYYLMDGYRLDKNFLSKEESAPLLAVMENLNILFGKNTAMNDLNMKLNGIKNSLPHRSYENVSNDINGNRFNINLSHFSMEQELRESLCTANKAIEEGLLLQFDYINRRMEYSTRLVEPYRISFSNGEWFLWAFCRDRKDFRKFKLVRIRNIKIDNKFIKKEITNDELNCLMSEGYYRNSIRCILKFKNKKGMQLGEHFSKENIKQLEDGSYIVEEYFPNDEGLLKFILSFGIDCEVLEPLELRERTIVYIKNLLDIYNG